VPWRRQRPLGVPIDASKAVADVGIRATAAVVRLLKCSGLRDSHLATTCDCIGIATVDFSLTSFVLTHRVSFSVLGIV
jgi:hypothetical protein